MQLAMSCVGQGSTVVLVHGYPLDARMWAAQLRDGVEGARVCAVDLRGRGGSARVDSAWTLEDLATDLAESVTGPIHLVGLSMGGYIGLAFARLFPERLSSLVLVDSRAAADSPEGAAGRIALADRIRKEGVGFLPDLLIPRLVAPGATEEVRSAIRQQILETPPETAAADAVAMANRLDARPYLGSLGVPFLAVHGTEDAIVPLAEAREMAALAKGRLEHVAGAGHMVPMEDPVACTRILAEWLREVEGR